jgi:hypothetical protein
MVWHIFEDHCDVTATSHVTELCQVSAMVSQRWQSQVISTSIYSVHSSHRKYRLFLPKKALLHNHRLALYLCSLMITRIINHQPPIITVIIRAIFNNHCDYSNSPILLVHHLWKFRSHDIHYDLANKLYASTLVTRSST